MCSRRTSLERLAKITVCAERKVEGFKLVLFDQNDLNSDAIQHYKYVFGPPQCEGSSISSLKHHRKKTQIIIKLQ